MRFKINTFKLVTVLFILILCGWGSTGHKIINQNSTLSFPPTMNEFLYWSNTLAQHASDADNRKHDDPTESPKHFIDIDSYSEFVSTGRISQSYDSVVAAHGSSFVINEGTLPWAIIAAYDSLKNCFARKDFNKAVLIAADLGHYVADSHQPLHITKNYDGQLTNQRGIHSRYESSIVDQYQSQIQYGGDSVEYISNVSDFVFNYIYYNYHYVDSVLNADIAAKAVNSDTHRAAYYQALWNLTGNFTISLFESASNKLANLIYTAWINAGSPMPNVSDISEIKNAVNSFRLEQNYPNPFNPSTTIKYQIPKAGLVQLKVYDVLGKELVTLVNEVQSAGEHSFELSLNINLQNRKLSSGVYFYQLRFGSFTDVKKFVLLK